MTSTTLTYLTGTFLLLFVGGYWWHQYASLVADYRYILVMDAGSTGTRLYGYKWLPQALSSGLPRLVLIPPSAASSLVPRKARGDRRAYKRVETEPALDKFLADPVGIRDHALLPLIDWAQAVVPPSKWSQTPLFLMATAGLRKLAEEERFSVLANVREILQRTSFRFEPKWARVINGVEEGIFGWIAVNYLAGRLSVENNGTLGGDQYPGWDTLGTLDLGGSSLEVSFVPPAWNTSFESKVNVSLGRASFSLFAHMHQHYGLNDAFDTSVRLLLPPAGDNSSDVPSNGALPQADAFPVDDRNERRERLLAKLDTLRKKKEDEWMAGVGTQEGGRAEGRAKEEPPLLKDDSEPPPHDVKLEEPKLPVPQPVVHAVDHRREGVRIRPQAQPLEDAAPAKEHGKEQDEWLTDGGEGRHGGDLKSGLAEEKEVVDDFESSDTDVQAGGAIIDHPKIDLPELTEQAAELGSEDGKRGSKMKAADLRAKRAPRRKQRKDTPQLEDPLDDTQALPAKRKGGKGKATTSGEDVDAEDEAVPMTVKKSVDADPADIVDEALASAEKGKQEDEDAGGVDGGDYDGAAMVKRRRQRRQQKGPTAAGVDADAANIVEEALASTEEGKRAQRSALDDSDALEDSLDDGGRKERDRRQNRLRDSGSSKGREADEDIPMPKQVKAQRQVPLSEEDLDADVDEEADDKPSHTAEKVREATEGDSALDDDGDGEEEALKQEKSGSASKQAKGDGDAVDDDEEEEDEGGAVIPRRSTVEQIGEASSVKGSSEDAHAADDSFDDEEDGEPVIPGLTKINVMAGDSGSSFGKDAGDTGKQGTGDDGQVKGKVNEHVVVDDVEDGTRDHASGNAPVPLVNAAQKKRTSGAAFVVSDDEERGVGDTEDNEVPEGALQGSIISESKKVKGRRKGGDDTDDDPSDDTSLSLEGDLSLSTTTRRRLLAIGEEQATLAGGKVLREAGFEPERKVTQVGGIRGLHESDKNVLVALDDAVHQPLEIDADGQLKLPKTMPAAVWVPKVHHPCLHNGYSRLYNRQSYPGQVVEPQEVLLVGEYDWNACVRLSRKVIGSAAQRNVDGSVTALGVRQPYTFNKMVALSGFYVVYHFLNLDPAHTSLGQMMEQGKQFCDQTWAMVDQDHGQERQVEQYCFRVPYVLQLLLVGLGLKEEQVIIGHGSEGWPLGAAVAEGYKIDAFNNLVGGSGGLYVEQQGGLMMMTLKGAVALVLLAALAHLLRKVPPIIVFLLHVGKYPQHSRPGRPPLGHKDDKTPTVIVHRNGTSHRTNGGLALNRRPGSPGEAGLTIGVNRRPSSPGSPVFRSGGKHADVLRRKTPEDPSRKQS